MILDMLERFLTTGGSETLGGNSSGTSDYWDLEVPRALEGHRKLYLNLEGIAALTGGTTPTQVVTIESDSASGFSTALVTNGTLWSGANIASTTRVKLPLPDGIKRFCRIKWAPTGSPTGGGTFKVFLSES